jgi:septum formation protein
MNPYRPRLILASSSPRRRELLAEHGYAFDVIPPSTPDECGLCSGESPADFVARVALGKALDVARRVESGAIVACDTIAELEGRLLGKPANEEHARAMLASLRGKDHRVYSGLCLIVLPGGAPRVRVARTDLAMDPLTDQQLEDYLATGLWEGKAGAFGYQDRLGWVRIVSGSPTNVVGLPMELLAEMLAESAAARGTA